MHTGRPEESPAITAGPANPHVGHFAFYNPYMGKHQYSFRHKLALSLRILERDEKGARDKLARHLGISSSSLGRLMNEQQNVTVDTLELICKRLKCRLSDLIPPE